MRTLYREIGIYGLIGLVTAAGSFLVVQNHQLRTRAELLGRRAVEPRAGLYVPAVSLQTTDAVPIKIGEEGDRQVLFFFNTTCEYCRASVPAWTAVARRIAYPESLDLVGIGLDSIGSVADYATELRLPFPVVATTDPRLVALFRVSSVPLLLVVQDGRVEYARLGLLDSPAAVDSVVAAALAEGPGKVGG